MAPETSPCSIDKEIEDQTKIVNHLRDEDVSTICYPGLIHAELIFQVQRQINDRHKQEPGYSVCLF